jgi:hypothetical protein
MAEEVNKIKYLFAQAIIKKLWVEGLITEDEMRRIDARNKDSFLTSKESLQ